MDPQARHRVLQLAGVDVLRHLPGKHNQLDHGRRGPKALAKAAAKKVAENLDEVVKSFRGAKTRDEGMKALDGLKVADLKDLAKRLNVPIGGRDRKDRIKREIVGHLVFERVAGRDLIDEVIARDNDDAFARPHDNKLYDEALGRIAQWQGFDAKPRVASAEDMDAAIDRGWTEVWRGVRKGWGPNPRTSADFGQDFRYGPFEPRMGIFGNGVYTSTRRVTAEKYRGRLIRADSWGHDGEDFTLDDLEGEEPPDSLWRMAIDPDARLIDLEDLWEEQKRARRVADGFRSDQATAVLDDPGRFAAARGYDVIWIRGETAAESGDGTAYPTGVLTADQYVILNRSAIMIQDEREPP